MPRHNLQEPLKPLASVLNDVVAESVGEHLARQRRDGNARALALQDIAEVLKVRVSASHDRVLQLEGGNIGAAHDLVRGVHVSRRTVRLRVAHLVGRVVSRWCWGEIAGIALREGVGTRHLGSVRYLSVEIDGENFGLLRSRGSSPVARRSPQRSVGATRGQTAWWG